MNPQIAVMNGEGRPRALLDLESHIYDSSTGTTYTATTVTEADGASQAITQTIVVAGKSLQILKAAHGLNEGDWINITGNTSSTPPINGDHVVTKRLDADNFLIDIVCTASSDDGNFKKIPGFLHRSITINMKVSGLMTVGVYDEVVYGKVTDVQANTLTVDAWTGGTPTDGKAFAVDGWIADLPYCKKLTETFTPAMLVHNLFRFRRAVKNFGYEYKAELDYSQLITGDTLLLLNQHLTAQDGASIVLIPRVDTPEYQYNVYLAEPITTSIRFVNRAARGHQGIKFTFLGKEPLADLPMRTSGWGYGWGKNYGNNAD